jgi:hypothetical protein
MEDRRMKTLTNVLWLFWLNATLSACANNDLRWTEEVKLSDGRIIQVQRKTEMTTHSGFPANRRGLYKSHEICYPPMNIRWKSTGGYIPDIFDIVDGRAYMHVPISDCFSCERYEYPSTDAVNFVWENGTWKRIRREDFPEASEWNLLLDSQAAHEEDDVRGFLSLPSKLQDRDRSMHYDQKRFGWKHVSESSSRKGRCNACRNVKNVIYGDSMDFLEILAGDQQSSCQ